jgi:hypothetical protein
MGFCSRAEYSLFHRQRKAIPLAEIFMEHSIFDEVDPQEQSTAIKLLESYRYWNKNRLLFNIIVGLAGLASIILFSFFAFTLFDIFGIVAWGIVANGLYSFGFLWEAMIITKSKGDRNLKTNRSLLFWAGTIAYVLVSISFAFEYFMAVKN